MSLKNVLILGDEHSTQAMDRHFALSLSCHFGVLYSLTVPPPTMTSVLCALLWSRMSSIPRGERHCDRILPVHVHRPSLGLQLRKTWPMTSYLLLHHLSCMRGVSTLPSSVLPSCRTLSQRGLEEIADAGIPRCSA